MKPVQEESKLIVKAVELECVKDARHKWVGQPPKLA
jgi:hypothetical protein